MPTFKFFQRASYVAAELNFTWTIQGRAVEGAAPAAPMRARSGLQAQYRNDFALHASEIVSRHAQQSLEVVDALRKKYETPLYGEVSTWSLVEKLAQCIDPTDQRLCGVSQQLHVLQILAGMENDGVATEELIVAALVHDLGKVLLLTDEAPENIVCFNEPIGVYQRGIGLDNCVFQWNHDEFAYSRLKQHLPDGIAWLVRYHSIVRSSCEEYMDARDRQYCERYLDLFSRYDHGTKSPWFLPRKRIDDYRRVLEAWLPAVIVF